MSRAPARVSVAKPALEVPFPYSAAPSHPSSPPLRRGSYRKF